MARKALEKNKATGLTIDLRRWQEIRDAIPEMGDVRVVAGVLEERYGKEPVEGSPDLTMAALATIHEFGTSSIPERSFVRSTMIDSSTQEGVARLLAEAVAEAIKLKTGAQRIKKFESTMSKVGNFLVDQVKNRIRGGIEPALAPATLIDRKRKGIEGSTPLLATRHLINAITWAIRPRAKGE